MLEFQYDQTRIYKLKKSEIFFVDNIQNTNVLTLKNMTKDDIGEVFLIKDENVEGITLNENVHYQFDQNNPHLILLLNTSLLEQYTNFYISVVSKDGMYLFEGHTEDEQLNVQIGGNDIELIERIYVFQRDKNYKNITISQVDLSNNYGINQKDIKFQEETENEEDRIWSDTLYIPQLLKDTYKSFYIKITVPRTGISTFMRDTVLQYKQFEF